MRLALIVTVLAALAGLAVLDADSFARAQAAEECTGQNCPPKDGQDSGGHDCESKKKEQTVS